MAFRLSRKIAKADREAIGALTLYRSGYYVVLTVGHNDV